MAIVNGNPGNNVLKGTPVGDSISGLAGNDLLDGLDDNDFLNGAAGNDRLFGASGNDRLVGGGGNDRLVGGDGVDTYVGGVGNDTYVIDSTDTPLNADAAGVDTVIANFDYTLRPTYENLRLVGPAIFGIGNGLNNTIIGNDNNNVLNGGGGIDTLQGGKGDDTYVVNVAADQVNEGIAAGYDTVRSLALNFTLGANLEALILAGRGRNGNGNENNNQITGNGFNNILNGLDGNDTIDGGIGADTLIGGTGNDTYFVNLGSDRIVEDFNNGFDIVRSSAFRFALSANLENLILEFGASHGTGNELNNRIFGNSNNNILSGLGGNDTLVGGEGADTLIGGMGDDTYSIDSADAPLEPDAGGIDTVVANFDYALGATYENLTLLGPAIYGTGNGLNNTIIGNDNNNILNGSGGNDNLQGGKGDDTYYVNSAGDVVVEQLNGGLVDTVISSESYVLGANVENLTLIGNANRNGTGNADNNIIQGNNGNNRLDGKGGADTLIGGAGNDTYVINASQDVVSEEGGSGFDVVEAYASFALSEGVENLVLMSGASIDGTGNSGNNTITGNAGNNRLDGREGVDTLIGGAGNDTYVTDGSDAILESGGNGNDTIETNITFSIASLTNVIENLVLTGTANIDATGNASNNFIIGNSGNNVINGNGGNDTLIGNEGNDTYLVDATLDTVIEEAGEGNADTVYMQANLDYTLSANVEILYLASGTANVDGTGNDSVNTIVGNDGNNELKGGSGNDTLIGGAGNDTLIGESGDDRLEGGLGNDSYQVSSFADVVVEDFNGGELDTVFSTANNYTLGANLENLVLSAYGNINGTGNALNNAITGNDGKNTLISGDGNDTISGGRDNDIINGGAGSDILIGGTGADNLTGGSGNDDFVIDDGLQLADIITDFSVAQVDRIVLDATKFDRLAVQVGNALTDTQFAVINNDIASELASAGASGALIVYNNTTGKLFYNENGAEAGLGTGTHFASLANLAFLSASNFFVQV
ncbi:calcium-binding protein [Leptolyngbya sp. FACHB-261]|uniref:beta strand repeat-containing protein n=1 Tax=Leptolyngbya sp. FACHB-261 TaxID=2692806 RepID=UPI001681F70D|nr:calcium-binding protein [Leptolyngbya sp. FACHB-261]MBD2104399.1 calcium-binding protein [Leptolyngbya sp. FACHB-261]